MLGLAQLGARLRLSSGPAQGSAGDWLGARNSGFELAWLRAQLGPLASAWCLGPGLGSVRFGSPIRLENQGSTPRLDPALKDRGAGAHALDSSGMPTATNGPTCRGRFLNK